MRLAWLKREPDCTEVIVVFGGWGIGPTCVGDLGGLVDILWVEDYRDLSLALPDLSAYAHRTLLAYSFGVACYGHWQVGRDDPFDRKVAVSGSPTPVDRRLGIPPAVFRRTQETLSAESFGTFLERCYGGPCPATPFDCEGRSDELAGIAARGAAPDVTYDRIWIASDDRIFPSANLHRAWAKQEHAVREIAAPHMPFGAWQRWAEVLA